MSDRGAVVAQWLEPEGRGITARAAFGAIVADGSGYAVATNLSPDAYLVAVGDGLAIDPDASSGKEIVVIGSNAIVVD